ncbi:Vacuolar protein-sorting-associated protein 25 [Trichinella pseudospiralis]|uniref:Vacuolar protein-sorting-associated protein 25 n=2 Tax=Trichinella pseudospiralis TaxID=6337 RepID=A0A0V1ETG9_TRIPS|nr:Vacuolar protein-sorting-associated protein 25 [Trichinella pseudospiralis]KRY76977.1 Vacuolar protein-sorting-associated protein 25 [Trichinella pseudospiralis]KRY93201.1 Vacuolar protein-sorting-associated protein 25 [Trichinella pseudospiralis]KRZ34509.1 Vacuolar protein-sorting-associated protein 25 [Trichinella pseudospiralis]
MTTFRWPWQYEFPPFFTLQPNLQTREKQLEAWASLVLNYFQANCLHCLDVVDAQQSELFYNTKIDRKLSLEGIYAVLDRLKQSKHLEWQDKQKRRCLIFWRSPAEWATLIYDWAVRNGFTNSVCTLFELMHGEDSVDEPFHKLNEDVLLEALHQLEVSGKAELILVDSNNKGIKYGALQHDSVIGKKYGSKITCPKGYVHVLRLTPDLWTLTLTHRTQILYTKDWSLVILQLELKPGNRVAEAGTGSGSLSNAIIRCIGSTGKLFTFDIDENRVKAANQDFQLQGYENVAIAEQKDVCIDGLPFEDEVDAVFLDLPKPWLLLNSVKRAMKRHKLCRFGSFSPCLEQVQHTCQILGECGFVDIITIECVQRTLHVRPVKFDSFSSLQKSEQKFEELPILNNAMLDCRPLPEKQPVHTGFLSFATKLPERQ